MNRWSCNPTNGSITKGSEINVGYEVNTGKRYIDTHMFIVALFMTVNTWKLLKHLSPVKWDNNTQWCNTIVILLLFAYKSLLYIL